MAKHSYNLLCSCVHGSPLNKREIWRAVFKDIFEAQVQIVWSTVQDLIIEAIYADIVRGKLDQKHQLLEVDYAIGRDIQTRNVQEITDVLGNWYLSTLHIC